MTFVITPFRWCSTFRCLLLDLKLSDHGSVRRKKTRIFNFGNKSADGNSDMKNLLGGKSANLAEMSAIGIPVPPGFTISTSMHGIQYPREEEVHLLLSPI